MVDNNDFENEPIFEGDTKTFDTASDDNQSLYKFANGEETLFEFKRTTGGEYKKALRRFNWFSLSNTRLIVYIAFFVVLAVFSVYYITQKEYLITAFATVAAAFMVYIIAFGHRLLYFSEECIDNNDGDYISCKLTTKGLYVLTGNEFECASVKDVTFKYNKRYIFFSSKRLKIFSNGLVFNNTDIDVKQVEAVFSRNNQEQK